MRLLVIALAALSLHAQKITIYGPTAKPGTPTTPADVGTSLPGTCTVGQEFFKSNETAGQNKYLCTGTDAWTKQAGGSASGLQLSLSSGTVTLSPGAWVNTTANPPTATRFADAPTLGPATGSQTGVIRIEVSSAGVRRCLVETGMTPANYPTTIMAQCTVADQFSAGAAPIGKATVTAGTITSVENLAPNAVSAPPPAQGTGILLSGGQYSTDPSIVTHKYFVSGSAPGSCPTASRGDSCTDTAATPPVTYRCDQASCTSAGHWNTWGGNSGSGGPAPTQGLWSARGTCDSSSANNGRIHRPTDAPWDARCNGTAWKIRLFNGVEYDVADLPVASNFTLDENGSGVASELTQNGPVVFWMPKGQARSRLTVARPGTAWTIEVCVADAVKGGLPNMFSLGSFAATFGSFGYAYELANGVDTSYTDASAATTGNDPLGYFAWQTGPTAGPSCTLVSSDGSNRKVAIRHGGKVRKLYTTPVNVCWGIDGVGCSDAGYTRLGMYSNMTGADTEQDLPKVNILIWKITNSDLLP